MQAWLQEKPTAWADDPCLAAAQMPREDALLEAKRTSAELLNKHLLGEEAEVRRLEEQCFAASTDLEEIISEVSHVSQRAELALRWFEAHDTWSGKRTWSYGGPQL